MTALQNIHAMNSSCPIQEGITLSHSMFFSIIAFVFLLGGVVGYLIRHLQPFRKKNKSKLEVSNCTPHSSSSSNKPDFIQDGPTQVLMGSLRLLSSLWENNGDMSSTKVVNYLSPHQMTKLLFSGSDSLSLDTMSSNEGTSPRSSTADISEPNSSKLVSPATFLKQLTLLQKYSVNTSHPYFFNQLFGSLDPIALAAEIVSLSVNTSVVTYETAPVFTLLEREVMEHVGRLVFGQEFVGEGMMVPGGSLGNLTALHAARHGWRVRNEKRRVESWVEEEKKLSDSMYAEDDNLLTLDNDLEKEEPGLVAFVSSEAHYSFSKSARVLGIKEEDLVVISTHEDGRMNVDELAKRIEELEHDNFDYESTIRHGQRRRRRVPFFVACTAGSTVRGSFDDIASIVQVCRDYESRTTSNNNFYHRKIWVHVDGAWGGSAIFSSRPSVRSITHMDDVRHADSFTFNPHKMLGAPQQTTAFVVRHRNALRNANATGAKYLFDPRKNGAEYDLGDLSYTCGRRTDAVKLWAMWKYYGVEGLGERVDRKVDELRLFVRELRKRKAFALACKPWLFNVNFFYFPPRIRELLVRRGILSASTGGDNFDLEGEYSFVQIPDDIAQDLANVSVSLKLRLHEAGEMIIPFQPLNNQKADCFRLVLAGKKKFDLNDICHLLDTMEKYGEDL